ncbi:hypothetical protein JG687_00005677 [Phytophthora cactorum]|uniref:Uncharacterized protein n=1 Tax=Phytophthora cactorum TaxID=29920 RepID=A0A8T1UK77_9STRA|nr:hypothetical protein JG687_00005677 [Phytophthora cactorum]
MTSHRIARCAARTLALPIRSARSDERERTVSLRGLRHTKLVGTGWSSNGSPTARARGGEMTTQWRGHVTSVLGEVRVSAGGARAGGLQHIGLTGRMPSLAN